MIVTLKEKRKGLFYLIAIAVMVAITGISCSESPTAPANLSESEPIIETPITPPTTEEEQTSTEPIFKIKNNYGPIQFLGLVFKDSTLRAEIKKIEHPGEATFEIVVVLSDGREYGLAQSVGVYDRYKLLPRDHSYSIQGTATFVEPSYLHLSIGGKNQALKLVK